MLGDSLEFQGGPWQLTRVSEFRGLFVLAEIPNTLECGTENELRGNRAPTDTQRREETSQILHGDEKTLNSISSILGEKRIQPITQSSGIS